MNARLAFPSRRKLPSSQRSCQFQFNSRVSRARPGRELTKACDTMSPALPPIAIVGAGLSGLTLGLCLKQRGIAAVIYDRATSSPRYNYGITLHSSTYKPLLGILHMDETTFREKLAVNTQQSGSGSLLGTNGSVPADAFRCHRGRLEALLGKDLPITWDRKLKDVQLASQSDELTMVFEDGTVLNARSLIGCDGPHSMTRQSLSPTMKLQVLPYVVYNGKRPISISEYMETMHGYIQKGVLTHTHRGEILLEISVDDISDSQVILSYTYSRPAKEHNDPLHKPDRPIPGATDIAEEFYEELAALQDLDPPFKTIFDAEEVRGDRVLHWLMRTLMPDSSEAQRLAKHDVVLIGDAVHATPILGGEGANMAIKDGIDLAQHIATHGVGTFDTFSKSKLEVWKCSVDSSKRMIEAMHRSDTPHL